MIVPGAFDVLASNVQSSAAPLLITAHVSVICRPVTPKFAVATVVRVNEIVAVLLIPPYEPLIVAVVGPLTTCVNTMKLALVSPGFTVTLDGTTAVPSLESATLIPAGGAGPVNVTVAVTFEPPTTVAGLTVIDASCSPPETVSIGDWRLLPFIVAVIVALPGATPVIEKEPDVAPDAIVIEPGTATAAGLLLESATVAPLPPAALASVTVPSTVKPAGTLVPAIATLAIAPPLGEVGEFELHATAASVANTTMTVRKWVLMTAEASRDVPQP